MMVKIVPRKNETIQATLRRFRKLLEKEGVIRDIKRKIYYEKPSEERSRIKRKAKREREKGIRQSDPQTVNKKR